MNRFLLAAYPFGLAGGGLCVVAFLLMNFLGAEPIGMNLVFGYIIMPLFVFVGIKNFRDRYNGGNLHFSQGMTIGFFVYSIIALVSAVFIYLYLQFDTSIFEAFRQSNLNLMEENQAILVEQLNQKAYEDTYQSIGKMNIMDVAMNDLLRKIIPGLFFTIIISIILKRTVQY
ncbi:MAG: DUF4199 domain-containing protein [Cyclobacteriaceae bacterium]